MDVVIYTAYNPPPADIVYDWDESKTRQSEASSCDINNIVSRYKKTGVLPANMNAGIYADVSQMGDYRTAVEQVKAADDMFMKLPSDIRSAFDNDAAAFLDFVSDPSNKDEMIKLGLVKAPPEEEPVVDPAPPSEADV